MTPRPLSIVTGPGAGTAGSSKLLVCCAIVGEPKCSINRVAGITVALVFM